MIQRDKYELTRDEMLARLEAMMAENESDLAMVTEQLAEQKDGTLVAKILEMRLRYTLEMKKLIEHASAVERKNSGLLSVTYHGVL